MIRCAARGLIAVAAMLAVKHHVCDACRAENQNVDSGEPRCWVEMKPRCPKAVLSLRLQVISPKGAQSRRRRTR